TITLQLPAITIVGATTEPHLLPPALVSRFPLEETVELYSEEELVQIVTLAATKFDKTISLDGARILARASKGTPRIAKALLARARDVARACHLTAADARATLEAASLDARGLGPNHRRALDYLRDRALGTVRLAGLLGLTAKAFRTLIEPDLLRMRLVVPTAQGLVPAACCKT
ncbi:MAG TPA: Holliday junction branch migration DNA helicase RuvB, partial [Planctomycetota bacterium]|nr:Holliday junction branch migration DNA helicase RuvB [Planctomycetota bacterium]